MDTTISEKLEAFFRQCKQQTYKKGKILIRADDDPSGIFYLRSGTVKMYAISKKGDEIIVNQFKPGVFFPMSWAMNATPNRYFFEAMETVEVWRAPKEDVVTFLKKEPAVLYDLTRRLFKGMDGLLIRMSYLMTGNAYSRLITELIIQAKRFGEKKNGGVEIVISETQIAMQSGMTRETVSREMHKLKQKGLVVFDKKALLLLSIEKLEAELEEQ